MSGRWDGLRSAGFAVQSIVLGAALALSYLLIGPLAHSLSGTPGVMAAALAAALCFVGAEVGLFVCHRFHASSVHYFGPLAAMLPRMGIPLIGGLLLQKSFPALAPLGFLFYTLAFFLVALSIETLMALPAVNPPSCSSPITDRRVT